MGDATCPSPSKLLPPGPSDSLGPEESMLFLSDIRNSDSGSSRVTRTQFSCTAKPRTPKLRSPGFVPPVRYDQRLTILREIATREFAGRRTLVSQNPEPRFPDATCQLPVVRPHALTPVSFLFYREIASSGAQGHRPRKTLNPESSGFSATCPLLDRRLRSIRGIAGRDFKAYETLASSNVELPNPDMSISDGRFPPVSKG